MASLEGGGPPRVSPFWGDIILWCETISSPTCGKYLTFFTLFGRPHPHLDYKPIDFLGEDLFFFFFFWSSHTFGPKTHLFCSEDLFFLVFTYFWCEKGCHHEIPSRVPPFLATPLDLSKIFERKLSKKLSTWILLKICSTFFNYFGRIVCFIKLFKSLYTILLN